MNVSATVEKEQNEPSAAYKLDLSFIYSPPKLVFAALENCVACSSDHRIMCLGDIFSLHWNLLFLGKENVDSFLEALTSEVQ